MNSPGKDKSWHVCAFSKSCFVEAEGRSSSCHDDKVSMRQIQSSVQLIDGYVWDAGQEGGFCMLLFYMLDSLLELDKVSPSRMFRKR